MNNFSTDTHFYDGKLSAVNLPSRLSERELTLNIFKLVHLNKNHDYIPQVSKTLNLFLRDRARNFDASDGVHLSQLLPNIIAHIEKSTDKDDTNYIWEQIADITSSGPCAQGRIKRLIQIYYSILN